MLGVFRRTASGLYLVRFKNGPRRFRKVKEQSYTCNCIPTVELYNVKYTASNARRIVEKPFNIVSARYVKNTIPTLLADGIVLVTGRNLVL